MTTVPSMAASPAYEPSGRPAAVMAGFERPLIDALAAELKHSVSITAVPDAAAALELLQSADFDVLCVGPGVSSAEARDLISAGGGARERVSLVLSGGAGVEAFQDLVDEGQLFYLSRRVPPAEEVSQLVRGALQRRRAAKDETAKQIVELCEVARYLAGERDPRRLGLAVAQIIEETIRADRARCLFHDPLSDSLLAWSVQDSKPATESAAAGIAGFVARTGQAVRTDRAGDDPRYDAEADNEGGDRGERLLAVPVMLPRLGDDDAPRVTAVLTAIRNPRAEPFSDRDAGLLQLLADRLAPAFDRVAVHADDPGAGEDARNIFRLEALRHLQHSEEELGRPMDLSPRWTRWAFPLIVLAALAGLAYAFFGTISEYARGSAFVRVQDGAQPEVVAFFPARFAPQLKAGMPLRFRVDGHPSNGETLTIASVSEIVGSGHARRLLGSTLADAAPGGGPVVVVRCALGDRFTSGNETYRYRNGLPGSAEVALRSDRILYSLMPSLRFIGREWR